ncbi:uncharacterized protein G2W53_040623 [Senna tora]|uniref:Uncharacterized protein n=1 Tax=Senna tora TaxID=362788 RepID=A0A834SIK3_9FABA|nr:uncharacterized protein G2W53_040623 [Senna tora]
MNPQSRDQKPDSTVMFKGTLSLKAPTIHSIDASSDYKLAVRNVIDYLSKFSYHKGKPLDKLCPEHNKKSKNTHTHTHRRRKQRGSTTFRGRESQRTETMNETEEDATPGRRRRKPTIPNGGRRLRLSTVINRIPVREKQEL